MGGWVPQPEKWGRHNCFQILENLSCERQIRLVLPRGGQTRTTGRKLEDNHKDQVHSNQENCLAEKRAFHEEVSVLSWEKFKQRLDYDCQGCCRFCDRVQVRGWTVPARGGRAEALVAVFHPPGSGRQGESRCAVANVILRTSWGGKPHLKAGSWESLVSVLCNR